MAEMKAVKPWVGGADCLNTIRLLAAIEVLYGHAIVHLGIVDNPIIGGFIHYFAGVPIFFTLSGFLMCGSILRSNSYKDYLKKRFWRIYPELWLAVLIEVIVLLILYHQPISWPQFSLFIFGQGTIFQFWTPDCLRAYGCGCPNGALWTITVLIQFYIIAYPIYKYLHKKKFVVWLLFFVVSLAVSSLTPIIKGNTPEIVGKLYEATILPYLWMFILALMLGEYKEQIIPFLKKYWPLFILATLLARNCGFDIRVSYLVLSTIFLILSVLGFGYRFPIFNVKTDISYGIYIYHMTVVNALIALGYRNDYTLMLTVFIATVIFAWISTKTVGQWGLKMKKKK